MSVRKNIFFVVKWHTKYKMGVGIVGIYTNRLGVLGAGSKGE